METTLNLNVTGKYMGQEYSGKITEFFTTSSYTQMTVELDAPITVFALGSISKFEAKYVNGNLDGVRKMTINLV